MFAKYPTGTMNSMDIDVLPSEPLKSNFNDYEEKLKNHFATLCNIIITHKLYTVAVSFNLKAHLQDVTLNVFDEPGYFGG